MENTDIKLENLIGNLKSQKPRLNDSDLLTDSIMNQIVLKQPKSKSVFVFWVRVISSSAAVLLFGLFFYQQIDSTELGANNSKVHWAESKIDVSIECLQNVGTKRANLLEVYFCYMKSNDIKNQRLKTYYQQFSN